MQPLKDGDNEEDVVLRHSFLDVYNAQFDSSDD